MPNPKRKPRFTPKTAAQEKADKYITPEGKKPSAAKREEDGVSLDGSIPTDPVVKTPDGVVVPFKPVDPIPELVEKSRSAGRPTKYSDKLANEIIHRLLEGASILDISRDPDMPARSTIMSWQVSNADFRTKLKHAKEEQADLMDDLSYEVARNSTAETAAADRVKLTAYAWRASHLKPRVYGNKQDVNINAQVESSNRDILQYLNAEQREQLRALVQSAREAANAAEDMARGISTGRPKQIEGVVRRG